MDPNRTKRNEMLAEKVIRGLASRNMTGYYAATKEEALAKALELIPQGCTVTHGGSTTLQEIGLIEAIKTGDYQYIDRSTAADKEAAQRLAYTADVYLGSTNAITEDGVLVNIDGNANRVSAYAYGPKKLVLIVGMNKVAKDVDHALKRARNEAAPINAVRVKVSTPCTKTGSCMDCKSPDTVCCQFLITRFERHTDRVHVILVDDLLGF